MTNKDKKLKVQLAYLNLTSIWPAILQAHPSISNQSSTLTIYACQYNPPMTFKSELLFNIYTCVGVCVCERHNKKLKFYKLV